MTLTWIAYSGKFLHGFRRSFFVKFFDQFKVRSRKFNELKRGNDIKYHFSIRFKSVQFGIYGKLPFIGKRDIVAIITE